jgi:hypothetical protein
MVLVAAANFKKASMATKSKNHHQKHFKGRMPKAGHGQGTTTWNRLPRIPRKQGNPMEITFFGKYIKSYNSNQ